jgi:hypothetical protein
MGLQNNGSDVTLTTWKSFDIDITTFAYFWVAWQRSCVVRHSFWCMLRGDEHVQDATARHAGTVQPRETTRLSQSDLHEHPPSLSVSFSDLSS